MVAPQPGKRLAFRISCRIGYGLELAEQVERPKKRRIDRDPGGRLAFSASATAR